MLTRAHERAQDRSLKPPMPLASLPVPLSTYLNERPNASPPPLAAGVLPVTKWSRARDRWPRRKAYALPILSVRSRTRRTTVSVARPKHLAAGELEALAPVRSSHSDHHRCTRGAEPRRTRPATTPQTPCARNPRPSRAAPPRLARRSQLRCVSGRCPTWRPRGTTWPLTGGPRGPL